MRVEVDDELVKDVQRAYGGPVASATHIIAWILTVYVSRDARRLEASYKEPAESEITKPGGKTNGIRKNQDGDC